MSLDLRPSSDLHIAEDPPPARRTVSNWVRRNAVDLSVLSVIVLVVGWVHAHGMYTYPARVDDEGTYMSQAWAVLSRFDLAHYTYWYDHPPGGWLILALQTLLSGSLERAPYGVAAGREAMLLFNVVSVALLYGLARRLRVSRWAAGAAALLFGLSPLGIFFHRMVLLDNIAMPFLLSGFVLLASPRRKLFAHVAAAVALAVAVLIRETYALFLIPAAVLYWRQTDRSLRRYSLVLTTVTFFGIVGLYPLFALLRGELLPSGDRVSLIGALEWQLFGRADTGSIVEAGSQAHATFSSWIWHDAALLIVGVMAALILLAAPSLRFVGVAVAVQLAMLLRPGYLPNMYVVGSLPFLALAIAGAVDRTWVVVAGMGRTKGRAGRLSLALGVGALVVAMLPAYVSGASRAMLEDRDEPFRQAQGWLSANLEPDDLVLLDSALWLDVVRSGHPEDRTIWFYKMDSDPGIDLPASRDWRVVDYVVTSDVVRGTVESLPNVEAAIEHGEQVAVFGAGADRVEILEVHP